MTTTPPRDLLTIRAERAVAQEALEAAKRQVNKLHAEFARTVLHEAFPEHSIAIFARNLEDPEPHLLHILSGTDAVEDVEEWPHASPARTAIYEAENAIVVMGHDDDILEYLDAGDEHEGWIEFQLRLSSPEGAE